MFRYDDQKINIFRKKGYKIPLKFHQVTHEFLVFSSSLGVAIVLQRKEKGNINDSMTNILPYFKVTNEVKKR